MLTRIVVILLPLLLLTLFSLSCKKEKNKIPTQNINNLQPDALKKFDNFVSSHEVACFEEEKKDCPESLARVLVYTPEGIGACTAFLVSEDTVMTNYHCLLSQKTRNVSYLKKEVVVIFPNAGEKSIERVRALSVVTQTDFFNPNPLFGPFDYIFLKLERRVDRKIFNVSFLPMEEGEKTTIWSFNFYKVENQGDKVFSFMDKMVCPVRRDSLLALHGSYENDPLLYLSPCEIKQGNSGSPILNSDGELKGIIYAGKKSAIEYLGEATFFPIVKKIAERNEQKFIGEKRKLVDGLNWIAPFGLGLNFRCLCSENELFLKDNPYCGQMPENCMKKYDDESYSKLLSSFLIKSADRWMNDPMIENFQVEKRREIGVLFKGVSLIHLNQNEKKDIFTTQVPFSIVDQELFNQSFWEDDPSEEDEQFLQMALDGYPQCQANFIMSQWGSLVGVESTQCDAFSVLLNRNSGVTDQLGINKVWFNLSDRD